MGAINRVMIGLAGTGELHVTTTGYGETIKIVDFKQG